MKNELRQLNEKSMAQHNLTPTYQVRLVFRAIIICYVRLKISQVDEEIVLGWKISQPQLDATHARLKSYRSLALYSAFIWSFISNIFSIAFHGCWSTHFFIDLSIPFTTSILSRHYSKDLSLRSKKCERNQTQIDHKACHMYMC